MKMIKITRVDKSCRYFAGELQTFEYIITDRENSLVHRENSLVHRKTEEDIECLKSYLQKH